MSSTRELVFVYGTLRRGGSNYCRMAGAEFVASATVRGRLYRIDWYPGLVMDLTGDKIHGEVFAVETETIPRLDEFVGEDYHRIQVAVETTAGEIVQAWVWEWRLPTEESQRIPGGDWLDVEDETTNNEWNDCG